jgi:hypothetical protein
MAVSTKPNFFLRRPVLSAVISIVITLVGALAMQISLKIQGKADPNEGKDGLVEDQEEGI